MNLLRPLALLLGLVVPALFAQGAAMLWTTSEINIEGSFRWTGIWAVPKADAHTGSEKNPMETLPPDVLGNNGGPGPWSGKLTVTKEFIGGVALYTLAVTGKHNSAGPTVDLEVKFPENDLRTKDDPDSKSHGSETDNWNLYVDPSNPERIIWVVTANHVPEPAASAVLAAAGLLAFGLASRWRTRKAQVL